MSIYKPRASPNYHFDFQLRSRRFHGSTGETSRRAAEAVEAKVKVAARAEVARSRSLLSAPMTIDIACDRYWIEGGQHHKRSDQTEWSLRWIITHLGKNKLIAEIGNDDVAKMVARRRGESVVNAARDKGRKLKPTSKLVSPSRVNRSVTEPLRKVLRRARDVWGQPVMAIDWKVHLLREPAERIRVLREGEEEARVFACLPAQYHPIVRVQMRIGLRIGELIALRWQDVDWGARRLTIAGKGGSLDTVPIPADVRDALWGLQGRHPDRSSSKTAANR
jgi:integrase